MSMCVRALVTSLMLLAGLPAWALDGEVADRREFPYVVQIATKYDKPKLEGGHCSATVLESRLLVTAAHCISIPYADPAVVGNYFENVVKPADLKITYI